MSVDELTAELEQADRKRELAEQQKFIELCAKVARSEQVEVAAFQALGKTADDVRETVFHIKQRLAKQAKLAELGALAKSGSAAKEEAKKIEAKMRAEIKKIREKYQTKIDAQREVIGQARHAGSSISTLTSELDVGCKSPELDRNELIERLRHLEESIRICRNKIHRPLAAYRVQTGDPAHDKLVAENREQVALKDELDAELAAVKACLTELATLRIKSVY